MAKSFNTSGACFPDIHYMVDVSSRADQIIQQLILQHKYFTINRARQYGKTTILWALGRYLSSDYVVLSLDFQKLSYDDFLTEQSFSEALVREILQKQSLLKTFRRRFWYRCRNGKADSAA